MTTQLIGGDACLTQLVVPLGCVEAKLKEADN